MRGRGSKPSNTKANKGKVNPKIKALEKKIKELEASIKSLKGKRDKESKIKLAELKKQLAISNKKNALYEARRAKRPLQRYIIHRCFA